MNNKSREKITNLEKESEKRPKVFNIPPLSIVMGIATLIVNMTIIQADEFRWLRVCPSPNHNESDKEYWACELK